MMIVIMQIVKTEKPKVKDLIFQPPPNLLFDRWLLVVILICLSKVYYSFFMFLIKQVWNW